MKKSIMQHVIIEEHTQRIVSNRYYRCLDDAHRAIEYKLYKEQKKYKDLCMSKLDGVWYFSTMEGKQYHLYFASALDNAWYMEREVAEEPQLVPAESSPHYDTGACCQCKDNVNHPKHYTDTPFGKEVIEITEHYNFCIGNALKYILRAGNKHEEGMTDKEKGLEDLKKARWYLDREISNREKGIYK